MEVRTRSRGKQQQQQQQKRKDGGSWRGTTDEMDVDEEDEERLVPVVSGENKRKRAPRGGSTARRVKLKPLTNYDAASDRGEASGSTDENGRLDSVEQADATSGRDADSQVEKRQSSRVKIKTLKLRENAEVTKPTRGKVVESKKDGGSSALKKAEDEEPAKKNPAAEVPPRSLKLHITVSESKQKPNVTLTEPKPVAALQQTVKAQAQTPITPSNLASPLSPVKPYLQPSATPSIPKTPASGAEIHDTTTIFAPDQAELETALKVIKKLMKMDAAVPFNKPVDPIGQGVPDYLEIIDTPMDFGTICETLEKQQKYRNALDVYRDIQQIWTNCRKYNHKGDPILDLMKKVQKACSKYWTANGVLRDPKKSKKGEVPVSEQPSDIFVAKATTTTTAQLPPGTSGHKASCGCVVCVAVRRRSAREKRAVGLGSARAVKRQIAKLKGKQDLNELEMEELMQLDEAYLDHMEEADQFFPASYKVPLRPVNPIVLSLGQALFGYRVDVNKKKSMANPFVALVKPN